jgi:photosystem II stability/assembly factor-like uncharacterized protein
MIVMMKSWKSSILGILLILSGTHAWSQKKTQTPKAAEPSAIFEGLTFRSIGPAFMSGRIADILIHPHNEHIWYVAVGSGGVWKTVNAGTTWNPIFDNQKAYSIGCLAFDPQNPEIIWVGTGENVGGRHVAWGDGLYKSENGGETWTHMGLSKSEHLSKIVIHPNNSNIMWVASQGPLWSKGGDRGVYKSEDGGKTWARTLGDAEWMGATDIAIDPRNPDVLYAATWQRHRTVAGYMGGGPGTGLFKSNDGGSTWHKLETGLPKGNLGKIGLVISPQNPDVVYAAIEQDRRTGGLYRSANQGGSWQKMSDAVSGGTGPHYYQELYACPHQFDRIYLADNVMQISNDGGKTFRRMNETNKHIDNHAVAFKPNDPNYLLVGTDGGLYETFDLTKTWRYVSNLPVTQFYKIAIDDQYPFYHVYGGTQDNNTQGGPVRTDKNNGITNADWFVVLGGDGHQPATEPGNPNIVYAQWQQGNLNRHDRLTGENVNIKPQARIGEPTERYNWDAPILVSPHKNTRLYFASQRVWKSEDRGDSWTPISTDLTRNLNRIETEFYGSKQGWDNPWDIYAMSNFSTITSLAESPLKEGLLYAGTDDGLIQITENGGQTWTQIAVGTLPGVPAAAFVNDIKADLHNPDIVYICLDNHKAGDYKPYLLVSNNRGKNWTNISTGLGEENLIWRIVQDHINPNLLFAGTERGVFFSQNSGRNWAALKGGMPPISIRDLAIHKEANDLVAASFGRGIFVLDDYSSLRTPIANFEDAPAHIFEIRKAWWYNPIRPLGWGEKGAQGDQFFNAPNPPFGAEITIYLKDNFPDKMALRKQQEKDQKQPSFPGWEAVEDEMRTSAPRVWLRILDTDGKIVKSIEISNKKGLQRAYWDYTTQWDLALTENDIKRTDFKSFSALPGTYVAHIYLEDEIGWYPLGNEVQFEVAQLRKGSLQGASESEMKAFWRELQQFNMQYQSFTKLLNKTQKQIDLLNKAYAIAKTQDTATAKQLKSLQRQMATLDQQINGSKARAAVGEEDPFPKIRDLMRTFYGVSNSNYGPTALHRNALEDAQSLLKKAEEDLNQLIELASESAKVLDTLGAPAILD